ncbi:hypothetical protein D1007_19255 [Hordeum vulgare]|nr:hypothetical protein D1007_19255 [Hordeum vulgare]
MFNVYTREIIKCPINKFLIFIKKAEATSDPVPPLEQAWVFIYGLPEGGKCDHILKAVSEQVGKLLTYGVDSLAGDGPTRIKILCQSLVEVEGLSLVFYFGGEGGLALLRA